MSKQRIHVSCCEWTTFISALSVAYNDEDEEGVGVEDHPDQVLIVLVIMLVQWLYLSLVRPLASPLAMTVEVASATCECMVALMVRPGHHGCHVLLLFLRAIVSSRLSVQAL